jgi:excisionase family DNA binding protein
MSDDKIFPIDGNRWHSREEMAEFLGVSERTVTRRVSRGEIIRRERPDGNLYRLNDEEHETLRDSETGHETGQDRTPGSASVHAGETGSVRHPRDTRQDRTGHPTVSQNDVQKVVVGLEEWSKLQRKLGQLEQQTESQQERVDELRSLAENERTRREEAEQFRARYYVQAGRRELAEERLEDRDERIDELEAEVAELRRKLEENDEPKTSTWSFFSD